MYDKQQLQQYIDRYFIPEKPASTPTIMRFYDKHFSKEEVDTLYGMWLDSQAVQEYMPIANQSAAPQEKPRKISRKIKLAQKREVRECGAAPAKREVINDVCEDAAVPEKGFELDESFREALVRMVAERGLKDSEVYKKAEMDRRHYGKIKNDFDNQYRPGKNTAICLALALGLNLEETQKFIGKAGYTLSRSFLFDVIIMYFLEEGITDISVINEALYEKDQSLLTNN